MCFGNTIVEVSRRNAFKLQKELFVLSDSVRQNQRLRTNCRKYDRDIKRVEAEGLFNGVFEVNHNLPGIDKITEKINSVADIFANVHPQVAWKAILLSGLATFRLIYKHWGDYETCFLTFFNFVNSLGLPSLVYDYIEGVFTQAYDKLSELTTRKVKAHVDDNSESSFDISPYLTILGGPIAVLLTALIVREIPGGDKPTEFLNRFSKIGSCVKTARDLHEVGAEFFNNIIEYVRVNVFGCDKRTIDEWASVNAWYAECMDIIPCFEEKLRADPTMKTKVDVLFERGLNIVKMLDMTKTPAARRDHVSKMMMTLAQFRDKASGVSAGQIALRVPPSIFHIFGDSGVGKSSILACLTADIQAALGVTDPKDINLLTYYRQPGRDFWDGYRNAVNLVVCDDFGAIVDSETRPNEEFLEAIRMSNTADYMLNMADLKDKGQTSFNAKAVIWTSNRSTFTCKSLTNYEAVIRRVAGKFRQRPAEGFYKIDIQNNKQVRILDTSKVAQKYGNLSIEAVCECIVFDEIDKVDGKIITEGMSYRQFSDKVVNSILSNKIYHEDFNTLVTSYAEQAIQRAAQRRVAGHSDDDQHVNVSDISAPGADADVHMLVWEGLDLSESNVSYRDMCFRTNKKEEAIRLWRDAHFTANLSNGTFEQKNKIFGTLLNSRPSVDFIKCNCAPDVGIAKIEHEMSKSFMSKCYTEIKEKFISWANFDTLVGLLKTVVSLGLFYGAGHLLGRLKNYFFPSARKVIQENYDTSKTRGRKVVVVEDKAPMSHRICDWCASFIPTGPYGSPACEHGNVKKLCFYCNPRLAEFYDNAKTVGVKQRNVEQCTCELYDTSKTDGIKRRSVELYDTSKTKGVKKINIEGCSGCGNCLKDSDDIGTPGYCNSTNHLKFAKVVPSQAVLDKNAADIVTKMCRNMYKLERQLEDGSWHHVINMLVIKGRLAITNRHVLGLRQHEKWRIVNAHKPDGYPLDLWTLNRSLIESGIHEKKDVMMFELPRVVEQHPDISDKFMDKCDFSRFTELKTVSLVGYVPQKEIVLRQYFSDLIKAVDEPIEFVAPGYTSYCRQYFEYGIQSTPGDCGGVLVAFDKNFHNKIFGIHAGGDRSSAYCGLGTPITRDILKLLENNLKCYADSKMFPTIAVDAEISAEPIDAGTHYDWKINLPFIGNFNFFGAVAKSVFASCDTAITPSPVHGVIAEPTMKPAHLKPFYSDGQRIDPMAKARIKASPAPVLLNKEILDSSVNHFTQLVLSDVCETDRRVLTYEEAIAGIHGDEFYAGLNRSTSPGYGWVKSGIGKQKWLGSGDEYDVTNQELIDAYNSIIAKCKLNRPSVLWQDTLKDERRPIAKVDAGKTRLFSVGEMSYTVAFRQYFLGFIAHMMRHKIDYESCVGVNCYSSDWSKIARKMQNVGKKVIAGDFGNYDGTLNAEMLWRVLDVIEQFYQGTEEEKQIRRALWSEVVNSLHINGNVIYGWTHSQPSGCPMTTILNCCYHSISARYVFLVCAMKYKPEFASLSNYTQYVRHINYGDDDVWNISDDIIEWFNQLTITEAYATIGMEYTDEAKTGNIVAYRSLNDINFLKRTFRWDNVQMRYRAPLALETVREMAMWNRKTSDVYSLTRDVLQDAVVELAQHSEDVFNAELPNFERARKIVTKRAPCYFGTYNEYQNVEFAKYCVLDN